LPEKVPDPVDTGKRSGQGSGSFSGGGLPEKVPDPVDTEKGSGTFSAQAAAQKMSQTPPREMEPDPSAQKMSQTRAAQIAPVPFERPSKKQVKAGVRRLLAANVDRKVVQGLRAEALSGRLSRAQWQAMLNELLGTGM